MYALSEIASWHRRGEFFLENHIDDYNIQKKNSPEGSEETDI